MRTARLILLATTCSLAMVPTAFAQSGAEFNAGAAQLPPRGNYDNYRGPGAIVLRRGREAQDEPGAAQEIAPDAKQSATGGPSGGLPGFGGGR